MLATGRQFSGLGVGVPAKKGLMLSQAVQGRLNLDDLGATCKHVHLANDQWVALQVSTLRSRLSSPKRYRGTGDVLQRRVSSINAIPKIHQHRSNST